MNILQNLAMRSAITPLGLVLLLSACGGSNTDVQETPLPPPVDQPVVNYSGPPASTDDVQNFKLSLWDNIATTERCGACHVQGEQAPYFARNDDINQAYAAANPLVNLASPQDSLMVTKVSEGHNCWLTSDEACGDILTTWISNWANNEVVANAIVLESPVIKTPGANKNFPADSDLFADNVHPLLETFCADCHANSSAIPISPYFASSDIDEAYAASRARINLDNPVDSRFVGRLRDEFHNCWSNCADDAQALTNAIQAMADGIALSEIDPAWIASKALTLFDGILASGGGRFEQDVIAKWEFKTGGGVTAFDTSGVEPAMNLTLSGDVSWIGGWGIQLTNGKAQSSTTSSRKIHDLVTATGEMSIEAWVVPANVTQEGPARIISYSGGSSQRNFTLGQTLYNYDYLLRTSETSANGEAALSTPDADEVLQSSLQHVVATYDPVNGRRIYVNGELTGAIDTVAPGLFNEWNDTYAFVLGNEVSGDIPWSGSLRMVAIHNRLLSPEQIRQNFDVGIGQKFFLLFGVSEYTDINDSYVVLEVSQFDSYSYLFSEPFFITLDDTASISETPIKGIRIGINGREAAAGQVFENLDVTVSEDNYVEGQGQSLSRLGTIVAVEKGAASDEFFLTFEQLGDDSNVRVEAQPPAPAPPIDLPAQSQVGMRNFAEINASMSAVTGVPMTNNAVQATFNALRQQLPTVTDLESFLASNQMAVTQLAIKYCDQLVESPTLRDSYFSGFDFTQPASSAFVNQDSDLVITPLLEYVMGQGLMSQPDPADVQAELDSLISRLTDCSGGKVCDSNYTATVVKATCAAALGSAALTLQ